MIYFGKLVYNSTCRKSYCLKKKNVIKSNSRAHREFTVHVQAVVTHSGKKPSIGLNPPHRFLSFYVN